MKATESQTVNKHIRAEASFQTAVMKIIHFVHRKLELWHIIVTGEQRARLVLA